MKVDLCPVGLVRSAGIPLSWLDEIRQPEESRTIDGLPDVAAERVAANAMEAATQRLLKIANRDPFRLAVAGNNLAVFERTLVPFAEGNRGNRRYRARKVTAFLQRFAAKNETAHGFGPVDRLLLQGDDSLLQPEVNARQSGRRAGMLTWWVVQALADAVARDPALSHRIPSRLHSLVVREPSRIRLGDQVVAIDADQDAALDALEDDASADGLEALRRMGLIRADLLVPPGQTDPALWLSRELTSWPELAALRWAAAIDTARDIVSQFSESPPESRRELMGRLEGLLTDLLGSDVRVLRDQHARLLRGDREILYEEAQGTRCEYRLGDGLRERLGASLDPISRLAAAFGFGRHRAAAEWLQQQLPEGGPLPDVAAACRTADVMRPPFREGDTDLLARFGAMAGSGSITGADVAELVTGYPSPALSFVSPDVMLDAHRSGGSTAASEAGLILGELHQHLHVLGPMHLFWSDADVLDWIDKRIPGMRDGLAQIIGPRTFGKVYEPEFGGWSIEMEARALRGRRVRFGDVRLEWQGQKPVLGVPGDSVELLPSDPDQFFYLALSPHHAELPRIDMGDFTPDLYVDDLLIQRRNWRIRGLSSPKGAPERFVQARRLRSRFGLPERVFVRTPNQRKPFMLDFGSPLLTDLFWDWVRPTAEIKVTPMIPNEDGLWLSRSGERFCSEIRLSSIVQ